MSVILEARFTQHWSDDDPTLQARIAKLGPEAARTALRAAVGRNSILEVREDGHPGGAMYAARNAFARDPKFRMHANRSLTLYMEESGRTDLVLKIPAGASPPRSHFEHFNAQLEGWRALADFEPGFKVAKDSFVIFESGDTEGVNPIGHGRWPLASPAERAMLATEAWRLRGLQLAYPFLALRGTPATSGLSWNGRIVEFDPEKGVIFRPAESSVQ